MSKSRKPQRRSPAAGARATTAARSATASRSAAGSSSPGGGGAVRMGGADTTPPAAGVGAAKAAAVGLWVLVGGGLLYGVTQTVIRASQLFS